MRQYLLDVNKIFSPIVYMDLQLLIKTSIDHESTHNHYLHIFMKRNIHKYVHTDIKIYAEGEGAR